MSKVRIVHNKLLGGWYVVRGPHQTPLSGTARGIPLHPLAL